MRPGTRTGFVWRLGVDWKRLQCLYIGFYDNGEVVITRRPAVKLCLHPQHYEFWFFWRKAVLSKDRGRWKAYVRPF